jgi:hypothetical protein
MVINAFFLIFAALLSGFIGLADYLLGRKDGRGDGAGYGYFTGADSDCGYDEKSQ